MAKITINTDKCKGCCLCVAFCPKKVIAMDENTLNKRGVHPVTYIGEDDECSGCLSCVLMCPDVVFEVFKEEKEKEPVAS